MVDTAPQPVTRSTAPFVATRDDAHPKKDRSITTKDRPDAVKAMEAAGDPMTGMTTIIPTKTVPASDDFPDFVRGRQYTVNADALAMLKKAGAVAS